MGLTGPWLSDSLRGIHHGGVYRHGVQGTVLASVVRRHRQERSDETDDRANETRHRVSFVHTFLICDLAGNSQRGCTALGRNL